ncbi:MAG: hypothetical protein RIR79_1336 [Pseudomonadota bacterium]|jgi:ribosomal-protein-alanine N-acetyltransferase
MHARFEPLHAGLLEAVLAVEQQAHPHPWERRHFDDVLQVGNQAQVLCVGDAVLGYFIAMPILDEVHLLNITVAPAYQGQGWARVMLDGLNLWARNHHAQTLWLEVRTGNTRALRIYAAHGFMEVGRRKNYYPAAQGQREDAIVMKADLL